MLFLQASSARGNDYYVTADSPSMFFPFIVLATRQVGKFSHDSARWKHLHSSDTSCPSTSNAFHLNRARTQSMYKQRLHCARTCVYMLDTRMCLYVLQQRLPSDHRARHPLAEKQTKINLFFTTINVRKCATALTQRILPAFTIAP